MHRCDVYNVTHDAAGQQLPDGYKGGLACCQDTARCHVKEEFAGARGEEYARYLRMKVCSIPPACLSILSESWP